MTGTPAHRRMALVAVLAPLLLLPAGLLPMSPARAAGPCDPPVTNPVACENTKPGNPESEWDISGAGDDTIQGFATDISANVGDTVRFKVKTTASAYRVDIYRIGWYQGNGARKVATFTHTGAQSQPPCFFDNAANGTLLYDCGNWAESASWAVPSDAVSGVYIAKLTRTDTGGASHIIFVVRDDASRSDLFYQTSDTTWQAYNSYGGASLYPGQFGRGQKVSYNRPFDTRATQTDGHDFFFSAEYPMVRFLERNGYDISYTSGLDSDRRGTLIRNHKVLLSSGHDEYWSGQQRANVEAARDAGVNLAFFSGNEVFWKTRYESSKDGTTPYRTLVCYKETQEDRPTDPQDPPTWTGTWRDPRFSPPGDGGRPENQLTGTAFMVQSNDFPMKVPAADGQMRFWRNTSVATQSAGQTATLADHTIGYESDEDLDNGFRPAGLVRLSTTTAAVDQYLQDYGKNVAPGTTTHHMTLYRAPSGALVFGAGTIQWSFGLDASHDGPTSTPDPRMQQATVNLLADMGAQPKTLMAGLVAATPSTDTTPPTSTITSPAAGSTVANGSLVTVTGTATDSGGGVVGGVEVSTDGGATWHPANGRASWTYTYSATGLGPITIKSRATDDSGNIETPSAGLTLNATCPCTLFGSSATPKTPAVTDTSTVELGVKLTTDVDGWITGIRFYKGTGNTGTHVGSLWAANGTRLATATFANESATGWQQVSFAEPVAVTKNTVYVASYFAPSGHYAADGYAFRNQFDAPPLHAVQDSSNEKNGVYLYGASGFPTSSFGATNYWVDAVFTDVAPPDNTPPTVTTKTPPAGASSVSTSVKPTVTFSERVQSDTISFTLKDASGTTVPGTVSYDTTTKTATLTLASTLASATTYTATVSGVKDLAGNLLAAPVSWPFTTTQPVPQPGDCPCSIWDDTAVPALVDSGDTRAVELGVKFRSESDGAITGIRFYKAEANTGTHTGSLWTRTGTQLATGTFTNETTAGWQTLTFPTPVNITAGTTYIASYHTAGHYSATVGQFVNGGVDNPPLHALAYGVDGPNGVYAYGGGGFPTADTSSNYWVDVVFAPPPDTTAPTIAARSPGVDATSVPTSTKVKATFSEAVQPATISFSLKDWNDAPVPAALSYDAPSKTVALTPNTPLAAARRYTATLSGATDKAGNVMTSQTWSFTTAGASACPCSIFDSTAVPSTPDGGDTQAVELGVKFNADVDGYIYGLRFYKSAANTGVHQGTLWSAGGAALATATFTNETTSGWQTVSFSAPVAVTAGTTYIASYHAPNGHYAATGGGFASAVDNSPLHASANTAGDPNGVYLYGAGGFPTNSFGATNYWVDVLFDVTPPPDTIPPAITSTSPIDGATSVSPGTTVQATFSEAVQSATVAMTLSSAAGAVSGSTTYDAATKTATFTPGAALVNATTYTARVSGAKDAAGNLMAPVTWTFTTASAPTGSGPFSIWSDSTTPGTTSVNDNGPLELGVKFRANVNGNVLGIRFYKGSGNTGTHTGSLWTTGGVRLATGTFTNESSAGWQTLTFTTPVAITAGTTYVASYYAPNGHYAADSGYFAGSVTNGPLTALANGTDGGNGVYVYGSGGGFPLNTYNAGNYWVDIVFDPAGT